MNLLRTSRKCLKRTVRRRDILPRDERRAFRAPSIGLYNLGEDEPLIPELAGDESFMGWPVIPGERGPDRRKKYYREKKRKRLFGKSESTRLCRAIEKKFDLPKLPPEPESPDYILDDSIPSDLPKPLRPEQPMEFSPLRRLPLKPIPSLPWEVDRTNFRHSRQSPPKILPNVGPIHMELYAGGGSVHPDLAGLVDYEPPLPIFEGVEDIEALQMGEELYYSPERYPEIDEIEINRRAAFAYEPPEILKNIWLSSPQDIGIHTPPSVGKGPMRTYTPSATPPLQILEASDFDQLGEDILTPKVTIPQDQLQEFFELTPPLEKEAYMQEMRSRTRKAEGRKGIRPKPMFFGGYGETPKRPIPRWYSRGGAVNIIRETEEPYSPPTPGTPPPQLPEMDEFVLLERQLEEEELNQRRSDDRQRQRDFSEMRRRMMLDEMLEQAERRDMESQRPPPRLPTPSPPPSSVLPQPDQYDEQQQSEGAPCAPWTRPAIDHAALEKYLLEEMGFGSGESFDFTPPPGTPEYLDQYTYDEFQGMESPLPLSPEDQAPCFPCTPPTPPSPPPPPPSYQPTESLLQMYIKEMERIEREKQEREARRQALYQSNLEEIQQMFGPSPGPPSPPDPDFYAKVYMHQVPDTFRQGYRPGTSIRDQIGKKEVFRQLPRRTPSPSLDSITEPRVRITIPQDARQKPLQRPKSVAPVKYASRQEAVATLAPTQPIDKRADAQRIAEARKQYQQMGRQKKILPQKGTSFARQPSLQGEDVETTCPGARRMITPEEGQRLAKERLRARKRKEEDFSLDKTKRASAPPAPPQNPPTNYFVPPQVQMRRRTPAPQIQSIEDFVRDPKVAVERTGSRSRLQGAHVRTQRPQERTQAGGGCGGSGQACGSVGPQISGTKVRLAGQQPAMRRPVQQSSRPQKGDGCGGGCGARGSRPGGSR